MNKLCRRILFKQSIILSSPKFRPFLFPSRNLSSASTESDSDMSNLPGLTVDQLQKIGAKDLYLRTRHFGIEENLTDRDEVRRRRMIYRSKQRGWLEADILLGSWAVENVPKLTSAQLDEYEKILEEETINIYNYVSMKDPLPDHLKSLKLMKDLQEYAIKSKILNPEAYEKIKRETNLT